MNINNGGILVLKQYKRNHYLVGWLANSKKGPIQATHDKFLLPIGAKVTDFKIIWQYLTYLQELAKSLNSKYVNVVMDMCAAINANKIIWNFPEKFGNIVIHPGNFHLMKENFQVHYRNAFI